MRWTVLHNCDIKENKFYLQCFESRQDNSGQVFLEAREYTAVAAIHHAEVDLIGNVLNCDRLVGGTKEVQTHTSQTLEQYL